AKLARRPYGPQQVIGEPDVFKGGDSQNAWCPSTADGQVEWLLLEYETPVKIAEVKVYANQNPGALSQISTFGADGIETTAWKGKDPARPGAPSGISVVSLTNPPVSNRIKIYLDPRAVKDWIEIDAVGIVEPTGKTHWAVWAE